MVSIKNSYSDNGSYLNLYLNSKTTSKDKITNYNKEKSTSKLLSVSKPQVNTLEKGRFKYDNQPNKRTSSLFNNIYNKLISILKEETYLLKEHCEINLKKLNECQKNILNSHSIEHSLPSENGSTDIESSSPSSESHKKMESPLQLITPKSSLVVTSKNITVATTSSNPSSKFSNYRTDPHFAFTVAIGSNEFRLQGIGVDKNGHIKASGSFGRVFFGTDQTGRKVAVKVAAPPQGGGIKALKKEGDFLCKMNGSSNVIGASEVGYMKGKSPLMFVVMEHIDGEELYDKLQNKTNSMQVKEKITALQDITSGLKELHDQGIVHRDLKPENVFVEKSTGKARIVDLGLSETNEIGKQTKSCSGSPQYFSPETLKQKNQGSQSDTYSFGIMMHEMLTGGQVIASPMNGSGSWNLTNINKRKEKNGSVKAKHYPTSIPLQTRTLMANLVNSCLRCKPSERISDENLINQLDVIQRSLTS
jgi:hypothetical protein